MTPADEPAITITPLAAAVQPLCNVEAQLGWHDLREGLRNQWFGQGVSANAVQFFVGVRAALFVEAGWLREEVRDGERLFWPAGVLKADLERDVEADSCLLTPDSSSPLVPTHPETIAAREIESGASQSSKPTAGADAVAPVAPGRWDSPPPPSALTRELGAMIQSLRIVSDEVKLKWLDLAQTEQLNGWKNHAEIAQATAHLRRLSSDFYNALADCEFRLELCRPKTKSLSNHRA